MAKIGTVQLLRGAAATSTVCAHVYPNFTVCAAGVDIFFAISGFVIVISSERLLGAKHAPLVFLRQRLIRIVPIYWLATMFALWMLGSIHPATVAASLFFVPHINEYSATVLPVLSVGWTLNLEMFFYVLFALALTVCGRMDAVIFSIVTVLLGLTVFGASRGLPYAFAVYWTSPTTLEFAFGMVIALAFRADFRLSPTGGAAIAIAALAILMTFGNLDTQPLGWWRLAVWGVPSAMIVMSSALVNWNLGVFAPVASLVGAASYAVCVTHQFTIAYAPFFFRGDVGRVIAALAVGLAIYLIVDLPIKSLVALRTARMRASPARQRPADLSPIATGFPLQAQPLMP
jgi:exopolysaccharide production protein ExoZ